MPRDDSPEHALREASWRRVRADFDRLASKPPVSLVGVVSEGDADTSAFTAELAARAREDGVHWQGTPLRPVAGRTDEYEPVPVSHRLFAFGDFGTWKSFLVAAMRAGVLATALPDRLIPAGVLERMSDLRSAPSLARPISWNSTRIRVSLATVKL